MGPGRVFIYGTTPTEFVYDTTTHRFCGVELFDIPTSLVRYVVGYGGRVAIVGSVYDDFPAPGCAAGAPCATDPPVRREDGRGVMISPP